MRIEDSLHLLALQPAITDRWREQLAEPHRSYHTLAHIEHMLSNIPASDEDDRVLHAAIWLHDIIYDPRAADNEERSADQAARDLIDGGIATGKVRRLIMATKRHEPIEGSYTARMMIDLDLLILGEEQTVYDRYAADIRREYAHVPSRDYAQGRIAVMERFLARPAIYHTPHFFHREDAARTNVRREIEDLRA